MKKKWLKILFILTAILGFITHTAATDHFFRIQFTDKNNSPYSISEPHQFLSERSIQRRHFFQIPIDQTDLPINPAYIQQVESKGVNIHCKSKWMNSITITTTDSTRIYDIQTLPFVEEIEYTGKTSTEDKSKNTTKSKLPANTLASGTDYGFSDSQISQVRGKYLHDLGYRGEGVYIAVLDGGFYQADATPAFNLLFLQNRLLGTKDFVNPNSNIYAESEHGTHVLSIMAADIHGQFIGTAPNASYLLIRTENIHYEYPVEMDFWISGLEYADSLGIDIVNSSLGYTIFDNPDMNLTHNNLNGETRISRAATLAAQKGIIVVNSAGNEGNKNWGYMCVPADAEKIITVGSVTTDGVYSDFSSFGPTTDGRIKPEIAALGNSTSIIDKEGVTVGNGTSYAAPIISGLTACYLQAVKESQKSHNMDKILQVIFESSNQYKNPTNQTGYGIPDFEKATQKLLGTNETNLYINEDFRIFVNVSNSNILVKLNSYFNSQNILLQVYSVNGEKILEQHFFEPESTIYTNNLVPGLYAVRIIFPNGQTNTQKIVLN